MPPSTTTNEDSSTATTAPSSSDADSDSPHAVFLYPTGVPTVNNIDTVEVSYDTIWEHANLTLYCETDGPSDTWAVANINMLSSEGTYAIAPIQADLDIPDFPVGCYFMIEDAKNAADAVSGARFTMASTKGVASTYGLEATVAASSATKTGTGASATTDADSSNGTATGSISASGGQGASSATGSNAVQTGVAAASSSSDGSLSSGAKAGLAIGIILAVIAILAGVFFFFRRSKRQMQRLDSNAGANTTEKVAAAAAAAGAGGARPSDVNDTGPETLVTPAFSTQANNRNSEDWRRFFGSGAVKREPAAS